MTSKTLNEAQSMTDEKLLSMAASFKSQPSSLDCMSDRILHEQVNQEVCDRGFAGPIIKLEQGITFKRIGNGCKLYADASSIGFEPGAWPYRIRIAGTRKIETFERTFVHRDREGDVTFVAYSPLTVGLPSLEVAND